MPEKCSVCARWRYPTHLWKDGSKELVALGHIVGDQLIPLGFQLLADLRAAVAYPCQSMHTSEP